LQRAILVDPAVQALDRVRFGMTVEVRHEDGSIEALTIVGEDEAEPGTGRISWLSPLAEALLDAEPGDEVAWQRPAGKTRLEIIGMRRS
jgi:transcription elongation GreA/GreB family factor